jgi:hypothetical protein
MATTTPNYGWSVPTSSDYVAQGAVAMETLGDSVDATLFTALGGNYPGLRLVKKQTIGTAVSSVAVTGAFSATYEDYLIKITGGTGSTDQSYNFQLTGITTGYYTNLFFSNFNSGTIGVATNSNSANFAWSGGGSTNAQHMDFNLKGPFASRHKTGFASYLGASAAGQLGTVAMWCASTASATGFTVTPSSGTMTGGTIYVYGYGTN